MAAAVGLSIAKNCHLFFTLAAGHEANVSAYVKEEELVEILVINPMANPSVEMGSHVKRYASI